MAVGARRAIDPSELLGTPPVGAPHPDAVDVVFECSGKGTAVQSAHAQWPLAIVVTVLSYRGARAQREIAGRARERRRTPIPDRLSQ